MPLFTEGNREKLAHANAYRCMGHVSSLHYIVIRRGRSLQQKTEWQGNHKPHECCLKLNNMRISYEKGRWPGKWENLKVMALDSVLNAIVHTVIRKEECGKTQARESGQVKQGKQGQGECHGFTSMCQSLWRFRIIFLFLVPRVGGLYKWRVPSGTGYPSQKGNCFSAFRAFEVAGPQNNLPKAILMTWGRVRVVYLCSLYIYKLITYLSMYHLHGSLTFDKCSRGKKVIVPFLYKQDVKRHLEVRCSYSGERNKLALRTEREKWNQSEKSLLNPSSLTLHWHSIKVTCNCPLCQIKAWTSFFVYSFWCSCVT